MTPGALHKVYFALGVIIGLGWTTLADNEIQNRSKYKYGYVISHKGGSTQAHLESRDGNLALGRYYVNLQNGTGQKVTYFADDLGFHTGVSYSSQNGKGSSKTHIAVGQKALAAFGDSVHGDSCYQIARHPNQTPTVYSINLKGIKELNNSALFLLTYNISDVTQPAPALLFGKKILKAAFNAVTPKPGAYPQLNYTPVPGGFYLTHEAIEASNDTTQPRGHVSDSTSSGPSATADKYLQEGPQDKANTQTFYQTSENVKNAINELHIESTTPSIKSYTSLPQQLSLFSPTPGEPTLFSPRENIVRVSSYAPSEDDLAYSKQKSIEKTNFADIDAQIISEVQKHAEEIIMKDLQKSQHANDLARLSSVIFQPSTVTMQPIVVTNDGETGINTILATTPVPEARIPSKNSQSATSNAIKTTGKNSDQALEDSGYFRVSLSPSLSSSINVSQTPHQSINVESTDRNSDSNNSTLCGFNLCEKDNRQIFSVDLSEVKPRKEVQGSPSQASDGSEGLGTNKIIRTFYPENKVHDERHYITTIDVQKAISLDVNQNEAGSIHLAQNFPFERIKPFQEIPKQNPTPQPIVPVQISVTPAAFAPELSLNFLSTPQKPYISNTVTAAPGLNDLTNQNLAVLNGLNDLTSGQYGTTFQDRIGTNRFEYENQLVVPPAPVDLTNPPTGDSRQNAQEDFREVEKSIQELRQQILSNIDEQHEEEQRKQNLVDQERKQYFQNLQKVEALKKQNSISYSLPVVPQSIIQATASPITSAGSVSNVELVPQTQYVSHPQVSYESTPQIQQYDQPQQTQYDATQPEQTQQNQYDQQQQTQYDQQQQTQYESPAQQTVLEPSSHTYQTEIKDFRHEIAVPQPSVQQIANLELYQKPAALTYDSRQVQTPDSARQYNLYHSHNVYAVDNNLQQSAPAYTTEKIQLSSYAPQVPPIAFQPRYAVSRVATSHEKPKTVPELTVLNGQLNTLPVNLLPQTAKVPTGKTLLLNSVVPLDYSRYLQVEQPVPLLQAYPVPLGAESKIVPGLYPLAGQVALPIQLSQPYKLSYPGLASAPDKQYHSTLTQRPTNKLRVQPLKPSTPDEGEQRDAVQNLLSQPQFQRTYVYSGYPINNRLQLRHIRKNQISNADQIRSQSVRRSKSLKNVRMEYGFKPPLRPSVEFSEEVKPSIYGSSVQPQ